MTVLKSAGAIANGFQSLAAAARRLSMFGRTQKPQPPRLAANRAADATGAPRRRNSLFVTAAERSAHDKRRVGDFQARFFHATGRRFDFYRDWMVTTTGNRLQPLAGEANGYYQPELLKSTDASLDTALSFHEPDEKAAVTVHFEAAAARVLDEQGKPPPAPEHLASMRKEPMIDALGFTTITRDAVTRTNPRYLDYSQPAAQRSLERGGTIAVHAGNFCLHRHFRDIARIGAEALDRPGPCTTTPDDVNRHVARFFDTAKVSDLHARPNEDEPKASITSAEVYDVMEGTSSRAIAEADERHYAPGTAARRERPGLEVIHASGEKTVDAREFRRLYLRASEASRTIDNLRHLREHGSFRPAAREAVRELQAFVHGTPSSLPTAGELQRDNAYQVASDRAQWGENDV
jgi:hypothetical protein